MTAEYTAKRLSVHLGKRCTNSNTEKGFIDISQVASFRADIEQLAVIFESTGSDEAGRVSSEVKAEKDAIVPILAARC